MPRLRQVASENAGMLLGVTWMTCCGGDGELWCFLGHKPSPILKIMDCLWMLLWFIMLRMGFGHQHSQIMDVLFIFLIDGKAIVNHP